MTPIPVKNNGKELYTFDAIVVGSGISGGWAAKELCEQGLKTLVLERGRNVEHITDYPTSEKNAWEFPYRLSTVLQDRRQSPVQSSCPVYNEATKHFFVNDQEHPYVQEKPFSWIRGYQVGGRSLTWARQCYRLGELDFEANAKDGIAVDWPIRYREIEPWYDYVEKFVGISGQAEGLPHLPDSQFLPPMELNCVETHLKQQIRRHYKDRILTIGRVANLTRGWNGRGPCQHRNLCNRGCPFGGYFSSNSGTLPAAAHTGNLTLRPDSIVAEVLYDEHKNRATGVRVIDARTNEVTDYFARIIFLNASTIATASILLNSVSSRFPNGLGNSSDQVGRNLMDHFMMGGAQGEFEGFQDQYYSGRRPTGFYVPRFRNISPETRSKDYLRGFGYQGRGERAEWGELYRGTSGFGESLKATLATPGPWNVVMGAWGETLPYDDNRVTIDPEERDQWGLPLVRINFKYRENEINMRSDIKNSAAEMLEKAGFKKVEKFYFDQPPGSAIHEMGTARMGRDPKTSVLNAFNQMHDVKNVYITDGSCMTSSACQNPSLTYMALTARACAHAVSELKKLNL
ncbi:GMC oxidoreductase [Larkinella sp. GY13]|uniref:GMC oxidoreductase n=1 Tax=Larkinella sp. GY13 TaxID=3453720 RepID=UPI003EECF6DE